MSKQIQATVVSIELNVSNGKYSFFDLHYVDANKERKKYRGIMNALKFNKVLDRQVRAVQPNDEVVMIMAPNKFKPEFDELQSLEVKGKAGAAQETVQSTSRLTASGSVGRDFETKDERQAKQVYIVRQSSLSTATALLKTDKKVPSVQEVIAAASQLEDYVFNGIQVGKAQAVGSRVDDLHDDLPFDVDDIPQ